MRLATRAGCLATPRCKTSGLQPAAPPAALYEHVVVRPRMVVVAVLTDVLQRLNVALSSMSVVGHIAMWFICSDDILLPDTMIYISISILYSSYVPAYILCYRFYFTSVKPAVMTAVAARSSSFVRSRLFITFSFSIICFSPAY